LAIASGATPIGSAGRAPDKKSRQKEDEEIEAYDRLQITAHSFGSSYIRSTGGTLNNKGPDGHRPVQAQSATFHRQQNSTSLLTK
jgi:hypothetical protein